MLEFRPFKVKRLSNNLDVTRLEVNCKTSNASSIPAGASSFSKLCFAGKKLQPSVSVFWDKRKAYCSLSRTRSFSRSPMIEAMLRNSCEER